MSIRAMVVAFVGVLGLCGHAEAAVPVERVGAIVNDSHCIDCHSANGVASDTRLVFPAEDASPEAVAAFGEWLAELIDPADPTASRLYRKPTERMQHAGGERIQKGTSDDAAWLAWVKALAARTPSGAATAVLAHVRRPVAEKGGRVLRRLTALQYDNTVKALLGDATGVGRSLPPEDFVDGFNNQHLGQSATPTRIEAFGAAAETLAENAIFEIEAGDAHGLLPCTLDDARRDRGQATRCRDGFIERFVSRAFRRPLRAGEHAAFAALFDGQTSFLEGVRLVIEAVLQAPSFLYLSDDMAPGLAPYTRASRLSYFLWNGPPDARLLERARRGELDTPQGLERTAREMLKDPRAVEAVDAFVALWLRFDVILTAFKDRDSFRQWNRGVARAMVDETRDLVRDLVWNDRNFMDLFTARHSFVTPQLAQIYGLPAPSSERGRVDYPDDSERAGVLGHGLFLAATSKPSETSPTARGVFVREHFLCQEPPPPPPSVNFDLPAFSGDRPLTNRERLAMHLTDKSCAGCHDLVDPIGFGFERFDAIGGYQKAMRVRVVRRKEDGKRERQVIELPLDTNGTIVGLPEAKFSGPRDIGRILAGNDQCQRCIVRQLFRYSMGRKDTAADGPVIDQVFDAFARSGFRFRALLVALARHIEFGIDKNGPLATDAFRRRGS